MERSCGFQPANAVERLARKKPVVVNLGLFSERLPVWLLVIAAMLAARWPNLALVLFLVGYAGHTLGAGLVATARLFAASALCNLAGLIALHWWVRDPRWAQATAA